MWNKSLIFLVVVSFCCGIFEFCCACGFDVVNLVCRFFKFCCGNLFWCGNFLILVCFFLCGENMGTGQPLRMTNITLVHTIQQFRLYDNYRMRISVKQIRSFTVYCPVTPLAQTLTLQKVYCMYFSFATNLLFGNGGALYKRLCYPITPNQVLSKR